MNRKFLLQALEAAGHSQLVLELDGPIAPLAMQVPDSESSLSILMPARLSHPPGLPDITPLLVGRRADHPHIGYVRK